MEQDNTKYVQDAFNALRDKGIVHTQKDFANLLEVDKTQISKALGGDEKNVTKNLLKKLHLIMEKVDAQVGDSSLDKAEMVKIIPTEALAGTLADYADSVQEYECERMVSPIKGASSRRSTRRHSLNGERSMSWTRRMVRSSNRSAGLTGRMWWSAYRSTRPSNPSPLTHHT